MPGTYTVATWRFSSGEDHYYLWPEGQINYNSSDALAQAALYGKRFIYVLDVFVNKLIASGQLVELFGEWATASRTFCAVTANGRFVAPKAQAFID